MSLARSASGPAGLTINTGAANSLSQPASSGGLFGTPSNTSAATPGAAATTTTTAGATGTSTATAGSMFGSMAAATQSTPAAGTGLFGNLNKPAATTGGSSLFGGGAAAGAQQKAPTAGGGLFGSAAPATAQAPAAGAGGGLFGQANQAPAAAAGSGGLFGQSTQTQNPAPSGGGGLFGQSQAKPAPGGLFGQSQSQPQAQPQAAQPQGQSVAAVQINYDNLRPRSRFDDLARPVQDEIALIDKGIARVIKMKDEISEFMPKHETDIAQLGRDVGFVESKFKTVQVALNRDIQSIKALQDVTKKNITDAQLSFKATDNLKLPTHYHQTGLFATQAATSTSAPSGSGGANSSTTRADAQDLITYFNRICDDAERYKKRLDEYRDEIERDMPGVENGLYEQIRTMRDRHLGSSGVNGDAVSDQLGQVLLALREMGTAIVNQAGQMADTRERLSRLQAGIMESGVYNTVSNPPLRYRKTPF